MTFEMFLEEKHAELLKSEPEDTATSFPIWVATMHHLQFALYANEYGEMRAREEREKLKNFTFRTKIFNLPIRKWPNQSN